jgi:hypothetical protein
MEKDPSDKPRIEYRPENQQIIQEMLDKQNSSLPDEIIDLYPSLPMQEICDTYPNQWIGLLPTEVGYGLGIRAGRVLCLGEQREHVAEAIKAFKDTVPDVHSLVPWSTRR